MTTLRTNVVLLFSLASVASLCAAEGIRTILDSKDPARATVRIMAQKRAAHPIPAYITGKFAEHLGANIYNGMEAQILRNPTFAEYPFWTGQMSPDGVTRFHSDEEKIAQELRRQAPRWGWPASELDNLLGARADANAAWWAREGTREAVQFSPDTGSHGGRAQRVQVRAAGEGIAQWVYLPLHRTRKYQFEIYARSPDVPGFSVSLTAAGAKTSAASATLKGLTQGWEALKGTLEVAADAPADSAYKLSVKSLSEGQFVVGHIFLWPADHINGADPDVIRLLKESRMPILRWPGGNFVSGYHWEDGVGPIPQRPTVPNFAWGGLEPNTFGTDEFIAFCRAIGAEPMICINAGNGTPAEAARWIQYCNGSTNTPMGARRAANGHPEPYRVKHWEVGNELWGRWQYNWTTASGYVDRYVQFSKAMLAADPDIQLYACGAPVFWDKNWNDTLIAGAARLFNTTTDHPLIGGDVSPATDPLDVYRDFMAVPEVLQQRWADLEASMRKGGVQEPHLAVTELQMFAHIGGSSGTNAPVRLRHGNLVNPATLAEGLYDVLIYHAAIRLAPFVTMVTHSATVNHGGGLRKDRERVYANPCHYAQTAFAAFAGATPVSLEISAAKENAPLVLPELRNVRPQGATFSTVDALAAIATDGSLLLSLVHRGAGPVKIALDVQDYNARESAEVLTLTANVPWAVNSAENPEAVRTVPAKLSVTNNKAELELQPYSFARVRFSR